MHLSTEEIEHLARQCHALASPRRIKILSLLLDRGEMNVTEICATMQIKQPTVSHHLRILREARLLQVTREGTYANYSPWLEKGIEQLLEGRREGGRG